MIDETLYQKHQNAITISQHTEISVQYTIDALEELWVVAVEKHYSVIDIAMKIRQLRALIK